MTHDELQIAKELTIAIIQKMSVPPARPAEPDAPNKKLVEQVQLIYSSMCDTISENRTK